MIFAAGLGTRLKHLTNDIPKALVPYKGKPLLQITIENLKAQGFDDIIVNVHHFSQKIKFFLNDNNNFDTKITISDETDKLLETGGGLFYASKLFDNKPFLVHNVDILSSIDLKELYNFHINSNATATLAVQNRNSSKKLYFSKKGYLCKWKNEKTGEEKISLNEKNTIPFAFSGIHIINPKLFNFMQAGKYSIIETYLKCAKTEKINYFDHTNDSWRDMGTPESFLK